MWDQVVPSLRDQTLAGWLDHFWVGSWSLWRNAIITRQPLLVLSGFTRRVAGTCVRTAKRPGNVSRLFLYVSYGALAVAIVETESYSQLFSVA